MKRFVYAPRVYIFVKDKYGEIHDLSRYVVSGSVERRLDAVSGATFALRNPEMMFTTHVDIESGESVTGPFTPMDPVTIWLRRVKGHPVRVFTGFLDEVPFIELFPGVIQFEASCTLKKLQYTFFDSGLPYMQSFLQAYGWLSRGGNGVFSSTALKEFKLSNSDKTSVLESGGVDGSIGQLLFGTLKNIGGWDPAQILIEPLPDDVFSRLSLLSDRNAEESTVSKEALKGFLSKVIGVGGFGNGDVTGDVNLKGIDGTVVEQVYKVGLKKNVKSDSMLMLSAFETGLVESNFQNLKGGDQTGVAGASDTRKSSGWRQETLSSYPNVDRNNVPEAANRYFNEGRDILAQRSFSTAGQLAQAIQKSAYPDKYDERRNDALALLRKTASKTGTSPDSSASDSSPAASDSSTPAQTTTKGKSSNAGSNSSSSSKFYSPIKGLTMKTGSVPSVPAGVYGDNRGDHIHAGLDMTAPFGTTMYAIVDSVCVYAGPWSSGEASIIVLRAKNEVPGYSGKILMGYGHASATSVKEGDNVEAGSPVGKSGAGANGQPHLHFWVRQGSAANLSGQSAAVDGNVDPYNFVKAGVTGAQPSGSASSSDSSGSSDGGVGGGQDGIMSAAMAASLGSSLSLPSVLNSIVSKSLGNERSLMNDTPLLPFIQQLANSSLRHFQSMPDGKFYAFYPDYFGEMLHHAPYWIINDIEILEGKVRLTDDSLVTHSFVVGDTASDIDGGSAEQIRMMLSSGIVTIFNAFTASNPEATPLGDPKETPAQKKARTSKEGKDSDLGANNGLGLGVLMQEQEALDFLTRYGARPITEDMPMIHSPQFELFLAYQKFMLGWSRQFLTPFTFTFMPELYPGGKVGFPEHGLQMYIESVTHSWDYVGGFTTRAGLSAPSAYGNSTTSLPTNMIRSIIEPANTTATDAKSKKDKSQKTHVQKSGVKK